MPIRKMTLAVAVAATSLALAMPLTAATAAGPPAARALALAGPTGTVTGTLSSSPAGPVVQGETVILTGNFASSQSGKTVTFFEESPAGSGEFVPAGTGKANKSGNATLTYTAAETRNLYANVGTNDTQIYTLVASPPDAAGHVNPITGSGKTVTAQFDNPAPGTATKLQVQRIPTKETNEVNSTDPAAPADAAKGPWVTIASSTQNASGATTFALPSPYPYRVDHSYRALSGPTTTPPVAFGLGQVAPKNSGLAALYFNTNENHAVDTRTRYFEGEFSMSADSKGLGCTDIGVTDPSKRLKNSTMKGRGNYSWSFRRKSFTLKLGTSTDLCGMGKSKKYALVSDDYDKSLLRNSLGGYVGKTFDNLAWTPDSTPVDLYLNGSYRGNYLLIERIGPDPARVNIPELKGGEKTCPAGGAKTPEDQTTNALHPNNVDPCVTGGYILEWDFRKGADYNVSLGSDSGYVGVKDPENDLDRDGKVTTKGISSQQKTYIKTYLNRVDDTLRGSGFTNDTTGWKKYIDQASAVDYYIAMEYMKPVDGNMWASVYMYKQRDSAAGAGDGKLYFGPMWDFDLSSGSANRAGNTVSSSGFYLKNVLTTSAKQSTKTWFNRLNEDPDFRAAVKARWNAVKPDLHPTTFLGAQADIISTSAAQTYSSFSHSYRISSVQVIKSNWAADVSYLKSWAGNRESWLNGSSGFN
jgi:hypothetical protein